MIEVEDCSEAVFQLYLEYLYSGLVDVVDGGLDTVMLELYVVSDRYSRNRFMPGLFIFFRETFK